MPQFDALARALGDDGRDDERQTLDNIMDYAAAAYAAVGDVVHGTPPRFARRALSARRLLEGRLAMVRDRMAPLRKEEEAVKDALSGLDGLIIEGWDLGARTSDGSLGVVRGAPRKVWSDALVREGCDALGASYDRLVAAISGRWKGSRTVKVYK